MFRRRCAAAGDCDVPCFHPLDAWQRGDGTVVFMERGDIRRALRLPCGRCIGCRLERSRQWALRCMHEKQMHEFSVFVTLTYSDDNLPRDMSLAHPVFQRFMKRLRKWKAGETVRYYMCGEYGEENLRPHYHALLFNVFFDDRRKWSINGRGEVIWRSAQLESLWPYGFSSIGDVTFESAAYVARYVTKKVTGAMADGHYIHVDMSTGEVFRREPEYSRMSLKPGIGATWYEKYKREVFPRDRVVMNGAECKPPRYYDKLLVKEENDLSDHVEYMRYLDSLTRVSDDTEDRLRVRETCAIARQNFKKRSL